MATFQLQSTGDNMEISTPGRHDDLEFDLDDFMQDDENADHEMRDQPARVYDDEDLIDYSDDDDYMTPVVETAPVLAAVITEVPEQPAAEAQAPVVSPTEEPVQSVGQDEELEHAEVQREEETLAEGQYEEPAHAQSEHDEAEAQSEDVVQAAVLPNGSHEYDSPSHDTDTGLHPVTFYYHDQTYALFKSKNSPGLLKDDNLVSLSLADLIKSCRQRLIIKGHDVGDHLEIFLTFENLRLTLCEDTPAAFQTSLKDVLDTYVLLQEQDGYESNEIPPLEITCETRMKFNNSIVTLQQAAERGEGLSNVVVSEDDIQPDDQPNYDEHEEDAYAQHEEGVPQYDDGVAQYDDGDDAQHEEIVTQYDDGAAQHDDGDDAQDAQDEGVSQNGDGAQDAQDDALFFKGLQHYMDENGELQVYDPDAVHAEDDATAPAYAEDDVAAPADAQDDVATDVAAYAEDTVAADAEDAAHANSTAETGTTKDQGHYEDELLDYSDDEEAPTQAALPAATQITKDDLIDYDDEEEPVVTATATTIANQPDKLDLIDYDDDEEHTTAQQQASNAASLTNGSSAPTEDLVENDDNFLDDRFLVTPRKRSREPEEDTSTKKARLSTGSTVSH